MDLALQFLKRIFPKALTDQLLPFYHYTLALLGALIYRFPSRHLTVLAITGTKGKTTSVELLNSILEEAGYSTAIISTLRFKVGNDVRRNMKKMTMPGRFFIQKTLREAVDAGCTHAIVEMTSEGAKQFRNKFIDLDALILTNIAPEHIESHGSYENYVDAKLSIARGLARSPKPRKLLVINTESPEAEKFLAISGVETVPYKKDDAEKLNLKTLLPGDFNRANVAGAATLAIALGIQKDIVQRGIEKCASIPGRMQVIEIPSTTLPFQVIVDYAHTPDSLEAVYKTFHQQKMLCVLGGTGGGRDHWKRPLMGKIADTYCSKIFLTDEDPYDEDPRAIVDEVASGIQKTPYEIHMDRRVAIREAITHANQGDIILITGKGTDPYIMGPNGTKTPWSDADISREEIKKRLA